MMQWKKSDLFPNYEISEFGDVRRCEPDKFGNLVGYQMTSCLKAGYRRFALNRDKKQYHVKASRLVAEAFIGPKPFEGACVCHNDGKKENDHFSNLRWDTHAGNMADKAVHGTGRNIPGPAKLVKDQVIEIKKLLSVGYTRRDLATRFDISYHAIRYIDLGKCWKNT